MAYEEREYEFDVTVCLGRGDGGDVCVSMSVSETEYELLKQCCRDDMSPADCAGLEELCAAIEEAAIDECRYAFPRELGDDESTDEADNYDEYADATCMISVPMEIWDEVNEEDDEEDG